MESTYGEKTLFSLFDMTESDGGKRCLEDWATHPISDWQMLHERQEAIRCPDFPEIRICREELDFIEFYLSQGDRPTRVTYLESVLSRAFRVFRSTPERYIIQRGTKLLENVLLELKIFADHVTELSPRLIRSMVATVLETYQATELGKMVESCGQEDGFYRTDRLDYISAIGATIPLLIFFRLYINWMPSVPCAVRLLRKDGVFLRLRPMANLCFVTFTILR